MSASASANFVSVAIRAISRSILSFFDTLILTPKQDTLVEVSDTDAATATVVFDIPDGETLDSVDWYISRKSSPVKLEDVIVSSRGPTAVGNVVSVDPGAYEGNEVIALTYQWHTDDSDLVAPVSVNAPVISGLAEVGETLYVSEVASYEINNGNISYQWYSEDP